MKPTQNQQKLCGTRLFNSINCTNKIRKVSENKFEKIYLWGKHAFDYSVIIENKYSGNLTKNVFPDRKSAIAFFVLSVKKYNN